MKLLIPLFFALAHGSCYDYEYYDPGTGASLPGNACAAQAAKAATAASGTAVVGQTAPQTFAASTTTGFAGAPATSLGASTSFGATSYGASTSLGATSYGASPTIVSPTFGAAAAPMFAASTPVYSSAPAAVYTSAPAGTISTISAPAYGTSTISGAVYGASTISAPVYGATVTTVRSPAVSAQSSAASQQLSPELEYYKELGQRQAQQHKRNTRIVNQAAQDLSKSSLVNTLVAGSGKAAPFYPAVRLSYQKQVANAYKSEKNIAEKNANDAYQRFQSDPSRVNLLVSKYQDLNADLRDAAYHYNVVNSGTFGQQIAATSLFGLGGSLINTVSQVVTQRQQSQDLQDIQRQMQRVQRQLQVEVQAAAQQQRAGTATSATASAQGSVQQRMMAMSVYGPAQRG